MSGPVDLVIYGRRDCDLCDEMADAVLAVSGDRVRLVKIEIDDDPALVRRYGADIPVLCHGDEVVCKHFLDPGRLARVLDAGG